MNVAGSNVDATDRFEPTDGSTEFVISNGFIIALLLGIECVHIMQMQLFLISHSKHIDG